MAVRPTSLRYVNLNVNGVESIVSIRHGTLGKTKDERSAPIVPFTNPPLISPSGKVKELKIPSKVILDSFALNVFELK